MRSHFYGIVYEQSQNNIYSLSEEYKKYLKKKTERKKYI